MKKINLKIASIFLWAIFFALKVDAQTSKTKNFSFHLFKPKSVKTNILTASIITIQNDSIEIPTKANGFRIELIGLGILVPLIPRSPIAESDSQFVEMRKYFSNSKINGINISGSGSVLNASINGVSIGYVGQIINKINGFSATGFMNFVQEHNGIMCAIFINQSYKMNGLQLGIFNSVHYGNGVQIGGRINEAEKFTGLQIALHNVTKKLKGVQIGLWNVNQKRKLPLINWNFKS